MRKQMRYGMGPALLVLLLALAACGGDDSPPAGATPGPGTEETPAPVETVRGGEAGTRFGVAGLIPPHYPDSGDGDWQALFAALGETGDLVGVYQGWTDNPGGVPEPVAVAFQVTAGLEMEVVVGIGVKRELPDGGTETTVDFADAGERRQFVETVLAVVASHEVAYLMVDTEVNRLWMSDREAFEGFVELYGEVYDAVKAVSPGTKVFTGFQYEMLRGEAFLAGGSEAREPQWELVDRFAGKLDLLGLTSYPFFDYGDPAEIPDDYYREGAERYGLPLAITELGWPSEPLRTAPESAYGGSEAEQAAFVGRFAELIAGVRVEMALWAFPHDPGPAVPVAFEAVSLRANDGRPKPALAAWQGLAGTE